MTRTRPTVADLLATKGTRQMVDVYVETPDEAAAAQEAEVDILTVPESLFSPAHRDAAPSAFVVVGLEYGTLATTDEYLRAAFDALRLGADAVWCAASLATVARLRSEGVPVVGHVGLIPPKRTWTGGFKAVGKTAASAIDVWNAVQDLESAGAFAAEIEVVPAAVASAISARTSLFMISMGSGSGCDAQYLFATDVLGTNDGHVPRHAKRYADLGAEMRRIQQMRIEAFGAYVAEVANGAFPDDRQLVDIDDAEMNAFMAALPDIDSRRPGNHRRENDGVVPT
ncbi:MAG: 3-methyl-2-oxobutanoate hydroxymethyltransferase [Ilumatobacteraceae bacterium]